MSAPYDRIRDIISIAKNGPAPKTVGITHGHHVTIDPTDNQRHWIARCSCHWQSLPGDAAYVVKARGQHHLNMVLEEWA